MVCVPSCHSFSHSASSSQSLQSSMMVSRALFPPKYNFIRQLIRPDFEAVSEFRAVSWRRGRLLVTAAAREEPVSGAAKKRVSKEVRKAMVEEYVTKYRAMNGGKFPSTNVIQKEVGGGYYYVRAMLQELQFKLTTMETKDENPIAAGRTKEVGGISPLSSKEIDGTSEVGEVLNSEGLVGTKKVKIGTTGYSTSSKISADNGIGCEEESSNITDARVVDNKSIEMSIEDENSGQTAKVTAIIEVREIIDSEVRVVTTSASNDVEILVDGGTSSQGVVCNDSGHIMVDTTILNNYSEASAKDISSNVGQTDRNKEISEVIKVLDSEMQVGSSNASYDVDNLVDGGTSSQGEVMNDSGPTMVDEPISNRFVEVTVTAKHESSGVGQIAKTNGSSEVTEALDSKKQVGTTTVSNDGEILAPVDSSSQGERNDNSFQTMVDTSNMTNYNEVCASDAKDETWLAGQRDKIDGISKENSEFPSKTGYYPSEVPDAPRSTNLGKVEETSSQSSESDQLTRENDQNEAQKTSIWDNLKSFASSIISSWRK